MTRAALIWASVIAVLIEAASWTNYLVFGEAGGDGVNWAASIFVITHAIPLMLTSSKLSASVEVFTLVFLGVFQWFMALFLLIRGAIWWRRRLAVKRQIGTDK